MRYFTINQRQEGVALQVAGSMVRVCTEEIQPILFCVLVTQRLLQSSCSPPTVPVVTKRKMLPHFVVAEKISSLLYTAR